MTHTRLIAAVVVFAGAAMTGVGLAQGAAAAAPQAPPAGQAPPPAAPAGRGAGGRQGAPGGGAANRGGFTQFTRPLAPQDVLVRGKSLYEANCASCYATDLRGGPRGTNLQRSGVALNDQKGELVATAVASHTPTINLVTADAVAVAEYIHSILAMSGGSGSPSSGRIPAGITLDVLVGEARAGEAQFGALCSSCHSVTGDLKGIGAKYPDARPLQNAWVAGSSGAVGGGGRGGGGGNPATVTMADGSKLEGTLVRKDDFMVVLRLPDGTRKSIARNPSTGIPKVDVKDPQPHKDLLMNLAFNDPDNKKLHDITAYLWTIK